MIKSLLFSISLVLLSSCSYKLVQHQNTYTLSKTGTNFYLIKENDNYLMVDTGTPNNGEKIEKVLLKNNIDPKQITHIILTHGHYDHAGNAAYFKTKFGTKIIAGKGDLNMIEQHGEDPHLCATSGFASFGKTFIKNVHYSIFETDVWIDKPYDLSKIGFSGKVIPLAGHTPGSLIVETPKNMFVGDLIRGSLLSTKKAKRHFYMCDVNDNNQDIDTVYQIAPKKTWYLGHGGSLNEKEIQRFLQKNTTPKTTH